MNVPVGNRPIYVSFKTTLRFFKDQGTTGKLKEGQSEKEKGKMVTYGFHNERITVVTVAAAHKISQGKIRSPLSLLQGGLCTGNQRKLWITLFFQGIVKGKGHH